MAEFLKRLFQSDFMPHGACWQWQPWVAWSNVLPDAVIFLCYSVISFLLIPAAVPIILCSGFNESEALSRFDDLDLAGFLQKPFGLGAMVDLVRRLLAGRCGG